MATAAAISVGDTQAQVLPAATLGYRFIAIGNNGSAVAYLKFMPDGGDVTTENGIPLQPSSALVIDQDESPICNNGIFAICSSGASTTLAVQAY